MDLRPIELMQAVNAGEKVDRRPWVPSIYEHGAMLLGKSPGEVSRSSVLMAEAALAAYSMYHHDLVTVGIDIYNIEAEAFGCKLSEGLGNTIPGITCHPLSSPHLYVRDLDIPEPGPDNRLGLITDAVRQVVDLIGSEVWIYSCMGGPFSQAVELRGFEQLIVDIYENPETVHELLQRTTELTLRQARRLSAAGAGVNLFESWATLPLIDPHMFKKFVVPYAKLVIDMIRSEFSTPPPALIMGGDTASLMDCFIESGTGIIAADFNTDFSFMREKIGERPIIIRGCVDPKMIERKDWYSLEKMVNALSVKAHGMSRFLWGCGCVSYDTSPGSLIHFKDMVLENEYIQESQQ